MPDPVPLNDKAKLFEKEQTRINGEKPDVLSEIDRAIIGGSSARLNIPITSLDDLRRVPELLRGLATYIEFKRQQRGVETRSKLYEIGNEVKATQKRIVATAGEWKFNKNGTVKR